MTTIKELRAEKEKLEEEDRALLSALWASLADADDSSDPKAKRAVLEVFRPRLQAQRKIWASLADAVAGCDTSTDEEEVQVYNLHDDIRARLRQL